MGVGGYGQGVLIQSGGSLIANDDLSIANRIESSATGPGVYRLSGGSAVANQVNVGSGGQGTLEIIGAGSAISFASYDQTSRGRLLSEINATGLSTIDVTGAANVAGTWEVLDVDAPIGRFEVMTADAGIALSPSSVLLPGPEWTWGIDAGTTLWVEHIPEPASVATLAVTAMTFGVRRRSRLP